MREIIDIIVLAEAQAELLGDIALNPSRAETNKIISKSIGKEARCILNDGNLYVWDAYDGTHQDAAGQLKLTTPCISFLVYHNRWGQLTDFGVWSHTMSEADMVKEILSNKNVLQAFGIALQFS